MNAEPSVSQAAPLTPHIDHMPSADAYRLGCEDTLRGYEDGA